MDAIKIRFTFVFIGLCVYGVTNSQSLQNATAEQKFTASKTSDNHNHPKIILFLFGTCILGALIRTIFNRFAFLPYELLIIVLGGLLGVASRYLDEVKAYTTVVRDNPENVLYIFLPVIAFEVSYHLDFQAVFKAMAQIFTMSIPMSIAATLAYGAFVHISFPYDWTWSQSLLFGSMISNIDPVTIFNIVKDISQGTNKTVVILLQGEAVLRSAISVILFTVFHYLSEPGADSSASNIAIQFALLTLASPVIGFISGKLTFLWSEFIVNDPVTEIMVTLSSAYLTFYLAEAVLGLSGVAATIVLGVTLSAEKTNLSHDMEAFHHKFWSWLGTSAQTLVFMMSGVVMIERAYDHIESKDFGFLFALYIVSAVLRVLAMCCMGPLLFKIRSNVTWREIMLFAWVGIRGTICLILGLEVIMDVKFDPTYRLQSKILFHCVGMVILTMGINVTMLKWVSKLLGLSAVSATKRMAMASAVRALKEVRMEAVSGFKTDRFLADADWDLVEQHIVIKDPYYTTDDEARLDLLTHPSKTMLGDGIECEDCDLDERTDLDDDELKEIRNEARLRLLKAEKMAFWKQFESGLISRESVRYLLQAADDAIDSSDNSYMDADVVKKSWKGAEKYNKLIERLKGWQYDKEQQDMIPPPNNKYLMYAYQLCTQRWFDPLIMFCVVVNIVIIIMEVVEEGNLCAEKLEAKYGQLFVISNYVFIAIYTFEAVFKIAGYRIWYFKSFWNWFDFLILLLSFGDLALDVTVFKDVSTNSCNANNNSSFSVFDPSVLRIAKAVRLLRILRSLKLVKGLIPQGIQYFNGLINKQLRYGYNVGKGFVTAEEEILGYIDYLIDEKEIAHNLVERCNSVKETIIHELGILQKENPGVAVSVKTHQAARRILNIQLEKVYSMRSEAIIDETEASKLESIIQANIKKLFLLPAYIDPPPPERILKNLSWLHDDPEVMEHIKSNAKLVSFTEGELLDAEKDPRGGIYIVISGLVKVEGLIADNSNYDEMLNDKLYLQKLGMRQLTTHPSSTSVPDETAFTDYLSTGQTVGEVSFLTNAERNALARCDTSVQLYHVLYEALQAAVDIFTDEPSLEKRMWKSCGVRVGMALLQNHFAFRRWTPEKIRAHLDRGYIWMRHTMTEGSIDPKKTNYSTFDVNASAISDMILVHGVVSVNGETLTSPCYIPNTFSQMLLLPCKAEKHVLLIVPRDAFFELGRHVSGMSVGAHVGSVSSRHYMSQQQLSKTALCLRHASLTRASILSHMSQEMARKLEATIPEGGASNRSNNAKESLLSLAESLRNLSRRRKTRVDVSPDVELGERTERYTVTEEDRFPECSVTELPSETAEEPMTTTAAIEATPDVRIVPVHASPFIPSSAAAAPFPQLDVDAQENDLSTVNPDDAQLGNQDNQDLSGDDPPPAFRRGNRLPPIRGDNRLPTSRGIQLAARRSSSHEGQLLLRWMDNKLQDDEK